MYTFVIMSAGCSVWTSTLTVAGAICDRYSAYTGNYGIIKITQLNVRSSDSMLRGNSARISPLINISRLSSLLPRLSWEHGLWTRVTIRVSEHVARTPSVFYSREGARVARPCCTPVLHARVARPCYPSIHPRPFQLNRPDTIRSFRLWRHTSETCGSSCRTALRQQLSLASWCT